MTAAAVRPQITPVNTEEAVGGSPKSRKRTASKTPNAAKAIRTKRMFLTDMAYIGRSAAGKDQGRDPTGAPDRGL